MKSKSFIALLLLVPAASLGVLSAMVWWPQSTPGLALFALCKGWLFAFPLLWHRFIDKGPITFSPARKGGFLWGTISGICISAAITLAYIAIGDHLIDLSAMQERIASVGLANARAYTLAALYWISINSVLEEYVWRWFVFRKSEIVFGRHLAVVVSALFFTLHHIVAMNVYMDGIALVLCATGIFIGGVVWSHMYSRFRSIWPGYLSHAIVDLCVFLIGAHIIF